MPAIIPFIPLIVGGVTAATSAYGAHKQASASEHAADVEAQLAKDAAAAQLKKEQEARDLLDQERNRQLALDAPYRQMREQALAKLGNLLGLDRMVGGGLTGVPGASPNAPTDPTDQTRPGPRDLANLFGQPSGQQSPFAINDAVRGGLFG